MWLDILLQNRDPLVEALSSVESGVAELRRLLEAGDRQGLERYLETAREFRRGLDR
jgi:prephenate dehydrogenase